MKLIVTADWHLTERNPVCRVDDFQTAQWNKVEQVLYLQKELRCPVIHAGDLFDHWKPSPFLLSQTIHHLPDDFYTNYGNHDLPEHSLDQKERSGLNVLIEAGKAHRLACGDWGSLKPESLPEFIPEFLPSIGIWHGMVWKGKTPPWPGAEGFSAQELLKQHPEFRLIITGHNHQSFVEELDGRVLINPGSLTRQKADQVNHQPRVYIVEIKGKRVYYEEYLFEVKKEAVSREHIEREQQHEEHMSQYISRLRFTGKKLSFTDNVETFLNQNTVKKEVEEIILKSIQS